MGTMHPDYENFYDKVILNRRNYGLLEKNAGEKTHYDQKSINVS